MAKERCRPRKMWEELVEGDLIDWGLSAEECLDRVHWKNALHANHAPSDTVQSAPQT